MSQIPTYVTAVPNGTEKVGQIVTSLMSTTDAYARVSISRLTWEAQTSASALHNYTATQPFLLHNPKWQYHEN